MIQIPAFTTTVAAFRPWRDLWLNIIWDLAVTISSQDTKNLYRSHPKMLEKLSNNIINLYYQCVTIPSYPTGPVPTRDAQRSLRSLGMPSFQRSLVPLSSVMPSRAAPPVFPNPIMPSRAASPVFPNPVMPSRAAASGISMTLSYYPLTKHPFTASLRA